MAEVPVALLRHTIMVEAKLGDSGYEQRYGAPIPVRCLRNGEVVMLADGTISDPVTIVCRRRAARVLGPGARVSWTGAGGPVTAYVQAVAEHADGGLGSWQHLEVKVS